MELRTLLIVSLITLGLLIDSTEAGWKFWKKDKEETTTTTSTTATPIIHETPKVGQNPSSGSVTKAIGSAADPGLVIGVGATGTNIKNDARPQKPNPGTDVGQDFPNSKLNQPKGTANGYRDWAVDLTGAGDPSRPRPQTTGSVGAPQGQPAIGTRPSGASTPSSAQGKPHPTSSTARPAVAGGVTAPPRAPAAIGGSGQSLSGSRPATPSVEQNQRPQSVAGGPISGPTHKPAAAGSFPESPVTSGSTARPTQKPAGPGKSWAEVAGSGGRPGSPTPSPRPVQPQPPRVGPGAVAAGVGTVATGNTANKVYSSNPTYSKGNGVTDEDLEKLSEALFIKDTNNAWRYITLNLQKKTTSDSTVDQAPEPLLTVNSAALQIPTIEKVLKIYDNYQLDTRTNEYISAAQRNEESLLVDTFLSTNVMSAAMRFLADKNFVRKDYYEYKDLLRRIWFNLYSRGEGKIGSAGFEHVFLTELKLGTEVTGLHNWIYFNAEELKRRVDYLGYIKKLDLGDKAAVLKLHAKFNGIDKPVTTMFIGTSPELEMALYTVCFLARPDQVCPVSLGGSKFNIVTHKFKYRGKDLIGSAYPEI